MKISKIIKATRRKMRLTQKQYAELLGLQHRQQICAYENDRTLPNRAKVEVILSLAKEVGIKFDYIKVE